MKEIIENIILHSQNYDIPLNTEPLLRQWYEAKKHFIKQFNGQTIMRSPHPIEVHLTRKQKRQEFAACLAELEKKNLLTPALEDFLEENEDTFFENRVLYGKQNEKLVKSLKKIVPAETLSQVQDCASRYIQKNKITGYLCISCNPLDYLTMSENANGWRTCQSLDGSYRAATLSYMVDSVTLVAYIADGQFYHYPALPASYKWYSKKMRMLVHTTGTAAVYNCTYPFSSFDFTTAVAEALGYSASDVLPDIVYAHPADDTTQFHHCNHYYPTNEILDFSKFIGYNDIVDNCKNMYTTTKSEWSIDKFVFSIGDLPKCPVCGKSLEEERSHRLICANCEEKYDLFHEQFHFCDLCGHRIYDVDKMIAEKDNRDTWYNYHASCYRKEYGNGK